MSYYQKRVKAFGYALKGIRVFLKEPHARIHLLAALVVISMSYLLELSAIKWCVILLCIGLVLLAEMLNSAVESTVNLVSPEQHPEAGKAKDIAAGAVLVVAVISAIVGSIIFIPELIRFFA